MNLKKIEKEKQRHLDYKIRRIARMMTELVGTDKVSGYALIKDEAVKEVVSLIKQTIFEIVFEIVERLKEEYENQND